MTLWNDPRTWIANELVTPAKMNTVRDNLRWLKDRPLDEVTLDEAANYSATTKDTWTAINASVLVVEAEVPANGRVEINFNGVFLVTTTNGVVYLDVYMAGDDVIADGRLGLDDGMTSQSILTTGQENVSINRVVEGLSEGLHTFTLYWKHSSSGTCTITFYTGNTVVANTNVHPQFSVLVV